MLQKLLSPDSFRDFQDIGDTLPVLFQKAGSGEEEGRGERGSGKRGKGGNFVFAVGAREKRKLSLQLSRFPEVIGI